MVKSGLNHKDLSSKKKQTSTHDKKNTEETLIENSLRPRRLSDLVGRIQEKQTLKMMVDGARKRKESVDHILFYGPPGLGKTTFAIAIANEIGSSLHITSGPAIERQGDLAAILTNLQPNDVLFIDEIHRLSRGIEEILYPAMEDMALDIVMGKGPSAKTIRLKLQPFTLIGATTKIGGISSPMRDRFGLIQRLDYFSVEELSEILRRAADKLEVSLDDLALQEISLRSRGTARIALRMLKRIRDYAQANSVSPEPDSLVDVDEQIVRECLDMLGVDKTGLEEIDRRILQVLLEHFDGGPIGLSTLAISISEDVNTLSEVYEPYLIKSGLLKRTARGRMLTDKGREYVESKL